MCLYVGLYIGRQVGMYAYALCASLTSHHVLLNRKVGKVGKVIGSVERINLVQICQILHVCVKTCFTQ